jgi:hypothetical protein
MREDEDAEHVDYVFASELNEIATEAMEDLNEDPVSLQDAQSCSDWPLWADAMDREIETLEQAGTWQTVTREANINLVDCKWIFHIKRNADGTINKHKARLVAQGFTQVYHIWPGLL